MLAVLTLIVLSENRCGFAASLWWGSPPSQGPRYCVSQTSGPPGGHIWPGHFLCHRSLSRKTLSINIKEWGFFLSEAGVPKRDVLLVCPAAESKHNTKAKPAPSESHIWPRFTRLIISNWICSSMLDRPPNTNVVAFESFITVKKQQTILVVTLLWTSDHHALWR